MHLEPARSPQPVDEQAACLGSRQALVRIRAMGQRLGEILVHPLRDRDPEQELNKIAILGLQYIHEKEVVY